LEYVLHQYFLHRSSRRFPQASSVASSIATLRRAATDGIYIHSVYSIPLRRRAAMPWTPQATFHPQRAVPTSSAQASSVPGQLLRCNSFAVAVRLMAPIYRLAPGNPQLWNVAAGMFGQTSNYSTPVSMHSNGQARRYQHDNMWPMTSQPKHSFVSLIQIVASTRPFDTAPKT
jgi:hypothetical protein